MIRRISVFVFLIGLLLGFSSSRGAETQQLSLKNGDIVCFVGDSITHAGGYINTLRKLLALRCPEMSLRLINCGVAGDTLTNVLRRFDSDIAANHPTCLFVMMGMNDNNPRQYTAKDTPQQREAKIANVAGKYQRNLQALAGKLKTLPDCRVVLLSPTPYDEGQDCSTPNRPGSDQGLQKMTDLCAEFAKQNGWGYIDLHTLFGELLRKAEAQTPPVNLINKDRVHPNAAGQIRMGMLIFAQLTDSEGNIQSPPRADIFVDKGSFSVEGCAVSGLKATPESVAFTLSSQEYPVIPDVRAGSNKELMGAYRSGFPFTLKVSGLSEGSYIVRAGGKEQGTFSGKKLADGIQLDRLSGLPCVETARKVIALADQLASIECSHVRDVEVARKYLVNNRYQEKKKGTPLPDDDIEAVKILLAKSTNSYHKSVYNAFLKYGSAVSRQAADAEISSLHKKILALAKPWSETFVIVKK